MKKRKVKTREIVHKVPQEIPDDLEDVSGLPDLLDLKAYTKWAVSIWNYDDKPVKFTLHDDYIMGMGLPGESGEVCEILKKHERNQGKGIPLDVEHLTEELGDVLYYLVMIAFRNGITLGDVIEYNIKKIEARKVKNLEKIHRGKRKAKKRR